MSLRALLTRLKPTESRNLAELTKCFSTTGGKHTDDKTIRYTQQEAKELQHAEQLKHGQITVREVEDVSVVSGVPEEHIKTRKVCIYQPPKNAMQSGTDNINYWQIDFDTRERWENPLMGWCSSGDPHSNLQVEFTSVDEAILHCKKMGWDYYIQKPNNVGPKARSYGSNFAWNKRTRVTTK